MIRVIPFIYSEDIAYKVELGDKYARIFYEDTYVDLITTPYEEEHLLELQFKQIADTMWIVHPSYAPRKLTRTSVTTFSLDLITFTGGPFLLRNDILNADSNKMTSNVTTAGDTGTLVATDDVFVAGHKGALFSLTYPKDTIKIKQEAAGNSSAIDVKGEWSFRTGGTWTGTIRLQRNDNSAGWEDYRIYDSKKNSNAQVSFTEKEDNIQYRISIDVGITGSDVQAIITVNEVTQTGVVRIDNVTNATTASITVMTALPATNGLLATTRWAEGAWSGVQGYPSSITFFEDRAIYAKDQRIDFSTTSDYEDFEEGTNDDDAFYIDVQTTNTIRWIESLSSAIAVGTSGDEWIITSNKMGTPLTPTNRTAQHSTDCGSSAIQPIMIDNVILFVDYTGTKLREFVYRYDVDKYYVAVDMNALAEHVTESGITSIALQKNPEQIIWCTLDDGSAISFSYNRNENITAWAKHPVDAEVISFCVTPNATIGEDEVWFSSIRTISTFDYDAVEKMMPRNFGTDIKDAFFVDSGITYSGAATATITGLTHLEGEEVAVLADGVNIGTKTVSGGQIILDTSASKVQVGLSYRAKLEPMRPDIADAHGSIVKVAEMGISFLDSMDTTYGVDDTNQYDIDWTNPMWTNNSEITGLFTGDVTVAVDGGFSIDNNLIVESEAPLPCVVRALIPRIDKVGR